MSTDIVTYLAFDGQCEAAFKFYEKALRGKILMMLRMADAPLGMPVPPGSENHIMHARLQVGDRFLMGGDAPQHIPFTPPAGFSVNIMVDTPVEADSIFGALSEDGKITMPIGETFWAARFGMLTDKFGVPWMINCEKPMA